MEILARDGFDASKFQLGNLCRRKHEWRGTEQSLRYLRNAMCVQCKHDADAEQRKKRKNRQSSLPEHIKQKLEKEGCSPEKYCLGSLCAQNHDYMNTGLSLRYIANLSCRQCFLQTNYQGYQKNIETRRQRDRERYQNNELRREASKNRAKEYERKYSDYVKDRKKKYASSRSLEQIEQTRLIKEKHYKNNTEAIKLRSKQHAKNNPLRRVRYQKLRRLDPPDFTAVELGAKLALFENTCAYCACDLQEVTWDHVLALAKSGTNKLSNLVPACRSCNSRKHKTDMHSWFKRQIFFDQSRLDFILQHTDIS